MHQQMNTFHTQLLTNQRRWKLIMKILDNCVVHNTITRTSVIKKKQLFNGKILCIRPLTTALNNLSESSVIQTKKIDLQNPPSCQHIGIYVPTIAYRQR